MKNNSKLSKYDHLKIERRWRSAWQKSGLYQTQKNSKKPKSYILDMFPYPSGEGLHVGHPKGYIATDIYSRYKRMNGFNILHPMGWDAFGLPAENYAIKNKVHPEIAVKKNIKRFKEQLEIIGFDYDWSREINTTDPKYYKWTQWIFLQLLQKGLAYQSYEPINWCPSCKTGLANEDLEDGKCERCGSEVEKKPMRQWVLKITDYADRLLSDLDSLAWPESIKESQRNWIGRSEGAEINFTVDNKKLRYVILHGWKSAPNKCWFPWLKRELEAEGHEVIVPKMPITFIPNVANQAQYVLENVSFDENTVLVGHSLGTIVAMRILEQLKNPIRKTVLVSGLMEPKFVDKARPEASVLINWNFNTEKIKKNAGHLRILRDVKDILIAPEAGLKLHQELGGHLVEFEAERGHTCGAVEPVVLENVRDSIKVFTTRADTIYGATYLVVAPEHPIIQAQASEILNLEEVQNYIKATKKRTEIERTAEEKEKTGIKLEGLTAINPANKKEIPIYVADYVLPDYGTGAIMAVPAHDERDWQFAKKFSLPIVPVIAQDLPTIVKNASQAYLSYGRLINSDKFNGLESKKAIKAITRAVRGKLVVKYKLRDWVFSRQRYWGEPIPVVHCEKCGVVPVPENKLPIKLPKVKSYTPTGTGESPLADIASWVKTKCPTCGGPAKRETNTMPQWAGSSWYYLRYMDPKNDKALVAKDKEKYWQEVDIYVGGTEHATRHLIYARFWHKFLFDLGVVTKPEPFMRLKNQGLISGSDGRKMSKRWGNVVNPDDVVKLYGADSLRVYEMFMGPFEAGASWQTENMMGARRFLEKVFRLREKPLVSKGNEELDYLVHQTLKKVGEDISTFSFNTAISSLMILVNELEKKESISRSHFEILLKILAPFAPHLTEELWSDLGQKKSIHLSSWPSPDKNKLVKSELKIVIQINGKARGVMNISVNLSEEQIISLAQENEVAKRWLEGREIKKVLYVKERLVNFVI